MERKEIQEFLENKKAQLDRLEAIDKVIQEAGLAVVEACPADHEGGMLTICLETYKEAMELHDLLLGLEE